MAETSGGTTTVSPRRDVILEAVAFAAERLLLTPDWRDTVDEVLARLGVAADVSRAYVVENATDDLGRLVSTWIGEWCEPGTVRVSDDPDFAAVPWSESGFGRWAAILRDGGTVAGSVRDFPTSERSALERHGVVSMVTFPITVGGAWWGSIGLDDGRRDRDWNGPELDALRTAATLLGAAIQRQDSDRKALDAEMRYHHVVDHIPAVTYTDIPGDHGARIGFVSRQIEDLLGYPMERFLGDPDFWFSLIHPEDAARIDEEARVAGRTEGRFDDEYRMIAADGREVWVHDTSEPIPALGGGISHWQGFLVDVTERRRAEDRVREAEHRYRSFVERIPAVTYTDVPEEGGVRMGFVSPQIEDILGYEPDRFLQDRRFWGSLMHPDDYARLNEKGAFDPAADQPFDEEYRMTAADGREVWVHDTSTAIHDESGRLSYWQGFMMDVTSRKDAQEQLRQAEERFRQLVEQTPAIVYQEAPDGILLDGATVVYVSPQMERILGYSLDSWSTEPDSWSRHIHPDDVDRVMEVGLRSSKSGEPYSQEYRMIAADGRIVWFHDRAVLLRDAKRTPVMWQGVMIDVTEQKEAEGNLRAAQERYRALVEHLPAVVYLQGPDGRAADFYISPRSERVFGYAPEEWVATEGFWEDHIHPDDRIRVLAADAHTDRTHEAFTAEYRFLAADGRELWVHDEAVFLADETGAGFWQGFLLDITERKRGEEQLRRAEQRFRSIVEQNPAVIYTQEIDPDSGVSVTTYISPRDEEITGYTPAEVAADPQLWVKTIHPDDRERVLAADLDSNREGGVFRMEYRVVAKDGTIRWVLDQATLVHVGDEPSYWQGFMMDITDSKEAEEQLARALEVEREATQRLRALDEMKNTFLQAVSHDLRTPLAAILGLAVTLERGEVELDPHDSRDLARRIADNARKLDRLVTNLLDMDRLARGIVTPKLHATDVGSLVRRLLAESELIGGSRVHMDIQPVVVAVDGAKVERIVENLLANTVRHTPQNAQIWVAVHPYEGGALLVVEDDGPGVVEDLREAIFEPFQQGPDAPQHSPGVGVGLTLVKRFAELHGGRAWVQERSGGGASFRVFLPDGGAHAMPPEDALP
jgi:PAS domain S-box-containing protein